MFFCEEEMVLHFHDFDQKQLNSLLNFSNENRIECIRLGHQEPRKNDILLIPSQTKFAEIQRTRLKYPQNWIFIILENQISATLVNEYLDLGKIRFLNELNSSELHLQINEVKSRRSLEDIERNQNIVEKMHNDNGQTLAIISHDLKNPLNAIRLDAQILTRLAKKMNQSPLEEEVRNHANRIVKTTDRLSIMVNDLLNYDRSKNVLTSLTRSSIDVEKLVDEVIDIVRPIAKRNSLKIKKQVPSSLPLIFVDKNKVFQVLLNLMTNALKFSPQHSSVTISAMADNGSIHFAVEDSGPGIDDNEGAKIFEKYWTGKNGCSGSGLGLYICKSIVEAHQGTISFSNLEKGGSRFFFSLPMTMDFTDRQNLKKIFLIDDDEDLRDVLSWALNAEGYHIESFENPESAFEFLNNTNERPGLILADHQLSEFVTSDLIERKRNLKLDNVPLLFLTAAPNRVMENTDKSLYSEIITKPLDLESILFTINKYTSKEKSLS